MALTRKSAIIEIGASDTPILTAGAAEEAAVVSLLIGNVDGTNDATVTVTLTKSGDAAKNIVVGLIVKAGKIQQVLIAGRDSLFLENSDVLSATANAASDLTATISYLLES